MEVEPGYCLPLLIVMSEVLYYIFQHKMLTHQKPLLDQLDRLDQ